MKCYFSQSNPQIYIDVSKTNLIVAIDIINDHLSFFLKKKLLDHNSFYTAEYTTFLEGIQVAVQLLNPIINICTNALSALKKS